MNAIAQPQLVTQDADIQQNPVKERVDKAESAKRTRDNRRAKGWMQVNNWVPEAEADAVRILVRDFLEQKGYDISILAAPRPGRRKSAKGGVTPVTT